MAGTIDRQTEAAREPKGLAPVADLAAARERRSRCRAKLLEAEAADYQESEARAWGDRGRRGPA